MIDESMLIVALVENKNEDWNVAGWLAGCLVDAEHGLQCCCDVQRKCALVHFCVFIVYI
jgi:hypothetical protein